MKLRSVFSVSFLLACLTRRLALPALVAAAAIGCSWPAAAQSVHQMLYKVVHATYGDIGTYRNVVQTTGNTTIVRTTVHLKVTMLGILMHQEDAERVEEWQNNRLISFHGVTTRGDKTMVVTGQAHGDKFVINSPLGTFTAPATVQPANPWSANCLKSTTMMRVDTGRVETVSVSGGQQTTVQLDGTQVPAREYEIGGRESIRIWIDRQGTPVEFSADDKSGRITFVLQR
jgi:hypothetical protein